MSKKNAVRDADPAQAKRDLLRRVDKENASDADRAAFRLLLRQDADKWRSTGNMITQARLSLVRSIRATGSSRELMDHICEELRKELAQPEDGALEEMLIDVAVLAWLRLSIIEQEYTSVYHSESGGTTLPKGIFWEKRLNAAHKRFLKATMNLARVRKLLRPKVTNKLSVGTLNALVSNSGEPVPASIGALLKDKSLVPVQRPEAS